MPSSIVKDYTDEEGYRWRVHVYDSKTPAQEGIPVSLDFPALASFAQIPDKIGIKMQSALWDMGVTTAEDFRKLGIYQKVLTAYRQAVGCDQRTAKYAADSIVRFVRETMT